MKHTTLIAAVDDINGASFVGLDTLTNVTLRGGQKNPQQGRVQKRMTGAVVMAFTNKNFNAYEAMVKRELTKEGKNPKNFELHPRKWGTRIPNMPIVEHVKDGVTKYYLEVIFMKPGKVEYLLDGVVVPETSIQGIPEKSVPDQGGLEATVILRDFAAESITALRIDGKEIR